jgi:transcriptional regulator with XRE-family HTH domain
MNSPLSIFLKKVRLQMQLSQRDFTDLLGFDQTHVSKIELGTNQPSAEFLAKVVDVVELSDQDQDELQVAIKTSRRHYVLPDDAETNVFLLCSELWDRIERLHPEAVEGLRAFLRMQDSFSDAPRYRSSRVKRANKVEAKM